jgi:putative transposase
VRAGLAQRRATEAGKKLEELACASQPGPAHGQRPVIAADVTNPLEVPVELTDEQFEKLKIQLNSVKSIDDLMGKDGVITQLLGTAINAMLEAERDDHLGYPPYAVDGRNSGNSRNGYSAKRVQSSRGPVDLQVPRDRDGTFTPMIVPPHQRVLDEIEDKVLALYARGMSTRDISGQLKELYGTEVSSTLISQMTDRVLPQMHEWQNRTLDAFYVMVFLDAIHMKIRREGRVQNTAVYTCIGVNIDGEKQLLGLWVGEQEGARFWQTVITEIANRGVKEILIACIDGLTGFPEAIASVFPRTEVQTCVIHAIRRSLMYVASTNRKMFMADLKRIYKAQTEAEALAELTNLETKWSGQYPSATACWRNNWSELSTFFAYPECIRRVIYTTNIVESVHHQMRKVTKTKGAFPSEEAALKLLFLNLRVVEKNWTGTVNKWPEVLNYLMISHHDRIKPYIH